MKKIIYQEQRYFDLKQYFPFMKDLKKSWFFVVKIVQVEKQLPAYRSFLSGRFRFGLSKPSLKTSSLRRGKTKAETTRKIAKEIINKKNNNEEEKKVKVSLSTPLSLGLIPFHGISLSPSLCPDITITLQPSALHYITTNQAPQPR